MLDAAARLFGGQRFHEVRMEDIAAEATVGKGTLYRYFTDKEELYAALLERASRQFIARIENELHRPGSPRQRLRAVVAASIAFFDEQPHVSDLIQRAEAHRDPSRLRPWQQARQQMQELLLELLAEAKAAGDFTIRDPEVSIPMLMGGLRSIVRFGRQPRARDLAERIVNAFLQEPSCQPPTPCLKGPP